MTSGASAEILKKRVAKVGKSFKEKIWIGKVKFEVEIKVILSVSHFVIKVILKN